MSVKAPIAHFWLVTLRRRLAGRGGFSAGISAARYQAVTQVSKATATRHLADLVAKGCLAKLPGGGRNTRYQILWPVA